MNDAVFIDRDGTLVKDLGFLHKVKDFKILPNVIEGLKLLNNYKIFITTNQSGIGRGIFKMEDFLNFDAHLIKELKKYDIKIEKTYYCPHTPEDNCDCRKPKIKFLKEAEKEFDIDLSKSFVIGDRKSDVDFGKSAGCKTVFVLTGEADKYKDDVTPDYVANDMLDAAEWILKN